MRHFIHLCSYTQNQTVMCTTVTLGKWQGGCYIEGDRYIQVNFAENIRQLKILGSCPVTVLYRVTKHHIQGRYIQV